MDKITNQITMLGTGNATVSQIYNTCFVLQTPSTLMLWMRAEETEYWRS